MRFSAEIGKCIDVLNKGGLILYPTDTIWGIGCDATNAEAVQKIYEVKKRPDKKAMIILVPDQETILTYVRTPHKNIFEYLNKTERPTTVIYNNAINLPKELIAKDNSIAIRIVKDAFCKELLHQLGKPIVSTSANISGTPSPQNFTEVDDEIKNKMDYIVRYRQEEITLTSPSSIIKLNDDGSNSAIRP